MATELYTISNLLDALVAAVDAARIAAAHDTRWLNAISSGYDWLLQQETIEFDESAHELVFTSESGAYRANGQCRNVTTGQPCKAFENGQACRHRSASRIVLRAIQLQPFTRIYAAFTAPTDALYYDLTTEEQALYWECYNAMQAQSDAEYNARRDARSAEIAQQQRGATVARIGAARALASVNELYS